MKSAKQWVEDWMTIRPCNLTFRTLIRRIQADATRELEHDNSKLRRALEKCLAALDEEALASDGFVKDAHDPHHGAWFNERALARQALGWEEQ